MFTFFPGTKIKMTSYSSTLNFVKFITIPIILLTSCDDDSYTGNGWTKGSGTNGGGNNSLVWLIPKNQVLDGGPGKDGIPALENPENIAVNDIDYLSDDDLVLGFQSGNEFRAYPHKILDWHEIINDELNGGEVAITYCPLTGTGIAWGRELNGQSTTFGVSGLLYNTNLIPYDRLTDSNWSQIRLNCVNGSLSGETIETFPLIETSWKTWKEMFPNSSVISTNTGFSRRYSVYPYGNYRTDNSNLLFPVTPKDERLPEKERVLGIIINNKVKAYQFESFEGQTSIILDQFDGKNIVVVGNKDKNFIVAYENNFDNQSRTFTALNDGIHIMKDDKGNKYNLFGRITEGVDKDEQLASLTSFMGYWFSFGAFYSTIVIYDNGN